MRIKSYMSLAFSGRRAIGLAACAISFYFPLSAPLAQEMQERSSASTVQPICSLVMRDQDGRSISTSETLPDGGIVTATCGGQGFVLGEADGFVAMPHRETGAVIAVVERESDSRVWLFTRADDGRVVLEELSYELAHAVGRAPTSGLVDLRINLSRFRATGVVSAVPSGREGARPARAADLALGGRLGAAPKGPAGGEGAQ